MTYKLVSNKSGKYTVEFDNGGCRPATDVEVALFKQRDELLVALKKLSGMKLNMIADGIVDKAISRVKESK